MPTAEAGWSVSGRAEARATGRRDGSTCFVLSRNSVTWKYHDLGVILSRNVLPWVICVTKLLDIVGKLCHLSAGETSTNKSKKNPSKKPNELVKKYSKESNAREQKKKICQMSPPVFVAAKQASSLKLKRLQNADWQLASKQLAGLLGRLWRSFYFHFRLTEF